MRSIMHWLLSWYYTDYCLMLSVLSRYKIPHEHFVDPVEPYQYIRVAEQFYLFDIDGKLIKHNDERSKDGKLA